MEDDQERYEVVYDQEHEEDDLAAARGLVHGCLASLVLWALILAGLWLATR